jgi:hypothetical protein
MKTVIEMAQQTLNRDKLGFWAAGVGNLEAFAELVRADEREACAKVCDDWPNGRDDVYSIGEAIRARSNT